MAGDKKIKVTLVKGIARHHDRRIARTVRGLGLQADPSTPCELADTPAIRGMINKVSYLV